MRDLIIYRIKGTNFWNKLYNDGWQMPKLDDMPNDKLLDYYEFVLQHNQ